MRRKNHFTRLISAVWRQGGYQALFINSVCCLALWISDIVQLVQTVDGANAQVSQRMLERRRSTLKKVEFEQGIF
jgi:hypothetical protein